MDGSFRSAHELLGSSHPAAERPVPCNPARSPQRQQPHDPQQLELTGTDARYETDLLGITLALLKSDTATGANAQIYTPNEVAAMMGEALMANLGVPDEGESVMGPAVGSGGLFRAAAEAMRAQGQDPATMTWYGADIDDLAIAACAINSLLWGLGPRIVLCVADTLTEHDWANRAEAQRAELLDLSEHIHRHKTMIAGVRAAQQLIEIATEHDLPRE